MANTELLIFIPKINIDNKECKVYNIVEKNLVNSNVSYFFQQGEVLDILKSYKENKISLHIPSSNQLVELIKQYSTNEDKDVFNKLVVNIWCTDNEDKNQFKVLNVWDSSVRDMIPGDMAAILAYTSNPKFVKD
jgi:hypothetical protein